MHRVTDGHPVIEDARFEILHHGVVPPHPIPNAHRSPAHAQQCALGQRCNVCLPASVGHERHTGRVQCLSAVQLLCTKNLTEFDFRGISVTLLVKLSSFSVATQPLRFLQGLLDCAMHMLSQQHARSWAYSAQTLFTSCSWLMICRAGAPQPPRPYAR